MSQEYVRDVVLAAVFCFIGGVVSTLLGVLIYVKVTLRKKLREGQSQKKVEEEEEEGSAGNHGNYLDTTDRRREATTRKPPMMMMMSENHGGPPWSRADEGGGHFNKCPECGQERGQRWSNGGAIRTMGTEEERERRRARMEEERRRSLLMRNSASPPWTNGHVRTDGRRFESPHCESCHQTYRGLEPGPRPGRIQRDPGPFDGPNQFEADSRRESRNVTFDVDGPRTYEEKARKRKQKGRSDSPRKLKAKLSPLRKSKVHPKKKSEHGHAKEAKTKRTKDGGEKRRKSKDGEKEDEGGQSKKAEDSNPNPPDSTASAADDGQSGNIPNQQAELLLRQLSSQHLGNRTANLSLLGPAGSHPAGGGVSLHGGNVLLNATAGAGVQFPSRRVDPAVPHLAMGGPHLASLSLNRQAGIGPASPAVASPVLNPQTGGVEPNPGQNQPLPDSSPLVAPPPGPRPQTEQVTHAKPLETQAPQTKENPQAPQGGVPSAPGSEPVVETEAGTDPEPAGSTAGGGDQSAGVPAGVRAGITAPGSGVPGGSSAGGDAGLLQQELVSEDGDSAPKRKLRLVLPEKTGARPPTALERKIR